MAMQFDSGGWQPRYDYSAFLSGTKNSMAEQAAEEEQTKSILANLLSAGKLPNEVAASNLEGMVANAKMNNPNYIPAQLSGDIAKWEDQGLTRDFNRDTLKGRTEFTNKDNAQKVLELIGKSIYTGQQNDELANIRSDTTTGNGQIGFSMAPETPKGPTPSALFATMQRLESGGQRYGKDGKLLTSPKGAQGENQVMPNTSRDPGFGVTPARDGSPDEIARVGKEYLEKMYERYQNPELALAAYNAGPGALDKIIAKTQKAGVDWRTLLPKETQEYLRKSGYANTEVAPTVLAPFAKAGSETPWSDQMDPRSKLGRMSAIFGMSPEYARQAALQEQRGQDTLENTRLKAEASRKLADPKYKEQLMQAFKTMADPQADPLAKYEAETVIYMDRQMRLAGTPGGFKSGIDVPAITGLPATAPPVDQQRPPAPPGAKPTAKPTTYDEFISQNPAYKNYPKDKVKEAYKKQTGVDLS